jgi:hypothetical protein
MQQNDDDGLKFLLGILGASIIIGVAVIALLYVIYRLIEWGT